MGERVTLTAAPVSTGITETVVLFIPCLAVRGPIAIGGLPSAFDWTRTSVRIKGTVVVTSSPGVAAGGWFIFCRRGFGTGGSSIANQIQVPTPPFNGQSVAFDFLDQTVATFGNSQPSWSLTVSGWTTAGSIEVMADYEEFS